ncbi:MAG: SOS response-associated peptidase [Nitrospirales bacterium]
MCGRFTRKESFTQLAESLNLAHLPLLEPRYNIAPSQSIACVRVNPTSREKEYVQLRWGLVPSWARDPGIGHKMINARAETVAEKPSFRNAFKLQRCLILADGFYEWKREGKAKQPYYIHMKDDRPFVFAGLWEHWKQGDDPPLESCAMITTGPNQVMEPIHHRMPVILHPDDYLFWLDPAMQDPQSLGVLLNPYPASDMEAYSISSLVNNPRNETPLCIQPAE